jgi:hypothetical protein
MLLATAATTAYTRLQCGDQRCHVTECGVATTLQPRTHVRLQQCHTHTTTALVTMTTLSTIPARDVLRTHAAALCVRLQTKSLDTRAHERLQRACGVEGGVIAALTQTTTHALLHDADERTRAAEVAPLQPHAYKRLHACDVCVCVVAVVRQQHTIGW